MNIIDIIFLIILAVFIYTRFMSNNLPKDKNLKDRNPSKIVDFPPVTLTQKEHKVPHPKLKMLDNLEGIEQVKAMDPSFNEKQFIAGSLLAFEMYYEARNNIDEDTLEDMLSPRLFDEVMDSIDSETDKNIFVKTDIKEVSKAKIVDARISGRTVIIDVKYDAEVYNYHINTKGTVKKGSKTKVKQLAAVWTWARSIDSDDPNWELEAISYLA